MTGRYAKGRQTNYLGVWPCVDLQLYDIRHLLKGQLPHLPGRLRAVPLWVEGTLLGLNGCQDTVTMALAHGLRGPRNPHTLRRLQPAVAPHRFLGAGPGAGGKRCFAPLLQWVRSWWVPTGGRELAQEPLWPRIPPPSKTIWWRW